MESGKGIALFSIVGCHLECIQALLLCTDRGLSTSPTNPNSYAGTY